jgi:glycosyltransferase involved in cell wall biosynthesis
MRIWLVNQHESPPIPENRNERLSRVGSIAHFATDRGHRVTWWSSTFSHSKKVHYRSRDSVIMLCPGLELRMIHAGGYRRNVSAARLRYLTRLASRFSRLARDQHERPDLILTSYPPVELAYEAVRYGLEMNVPAVLDVRDMWPDALVRLVPKALYSLANALLTPMREKGRFACSRATSIIGITDEFVEWGATMGCRARSSVDRAFPFSYTPAPPTAESIRRAEQFWGELGVLATDGIFTICFFGTMGRVLDVKTIIEAARILHFRGANVRFVLCGTGENLETYKKDAADLNNVIFPGWVGQAEIHVLMGLSDAGIDPLPDTEDFLKTINNKAVEYLSAGLPILVSPDKGVLHRLVRENDCGLSYGHKDAYGLGQAVEKMMVCPARLQAMAANSASLFATVFSPGIVYGGILDHLESLVSSNLTP